MDQQSIRTYVSKCIEQYCNEHQYKMRYDSSDHSEYFFIDLGCDAILKIRLSNHDVKNYCCSLNIRYDRIGKNTNQKTIKQNIYRRIDKCIIDEKKYNLNRILKNIKKED